MVTTAHANTLDMATSQSQASHGQQQPAQQHNTPGDASSPQPHGLMQGIFTTPASSVVTNARSYASTTTSSTGYTSSTSYTGSEATFDPVDDAQFLLQPDIPSPAPEPYPLTWSALQIHDAAMIRREGLYGSGSGGGGGDDDDMLLDMHSSFHGNSSTRRGPKTSSTTTRSSSSDSIWAPMFSSIDAEVAGVGHQFTHDTVNPTHIDCDLDRDGDMEQGSTSTQ